MANGGIKPAKNMETEEMMQLTKIYDSRTINDVFNEGPVVLKAEFKCEDGSTYFGWKFPEGEFHFTGVNYNFFKSSLPCGKKCCRKPSSRQIDQMLKLIEENKSSAKTF